MKTICFGWLLLSLLNAGARTDFAPSTNDVVVHFFPNEMGDAIHTVSLEQLTSGSRWRPGYEPFPAKLENVATRAISYFRQSRQETNELFILDIWIQRLFFLDLQPACRGRTAEDLTNLWVIVMDIGVKYVGPSANDPKFLLRPSHVAALLDGTLATEHAGVASFPIVCNPARYKESRSILSRSVFNLGESNSPSIIDPWTVLLNTDFNIPHIQWDPSHAPLFMDLNTQAIRSGKYLREEQGAPAEISLNDIRISHFTPIGALRARKMDLEGNENHRHVLFRYLDNKKRRYESHVFLDGTIYASVLPPENSEK